MARSSPLSPSSTSASDDDDEEEEEEERVRESGGLYSLAQENDSASSLPSSVNALGSIALEGPSSTEKLVKNERSPPSFLYNRYRPPHLVSAAHLPFEIITQILHMLEPQDLRQAIMVCKTWCRAGVEMLWHKLVFHKNPGGSLIKMLVVLSRKTPLHCDTVDSTVSSPSPPPTTFPYALFVKRINLTAIHNQLSDQILSRFAVCTRLERLTLTGSKQITDSGLIALISQTHDLVALDVSDTKIGDPAVLAVAENCPRLQGLNLTGCTRVTDASVVPVAQNCRQMRRIKLMGLVKLTSASVHALALFCPLLLEVDLANCPQAASTTAIGSVFRWVTQLRELKLNQCNQIWEDGFPRAGDGWSLGWPGTEEDAAINRQGLEQFESQHGPLEVSPRISEVLVEAPLLEEAGSWSIQPLRSPPDQIAFEHLRVLDLTAVVGLTDQALTNILSSAPKIRNLCLAKCSHLTNRSLIRICDLGRFLHYLHLGHVNATNDETVVAIARSCNRLRFIDLACCSLITDVSVEELANHLPKLKRIGLVKVSLLTDRAIWALAKGSAPLERVHLSYCTKITLSSVTHLLRRLPGLTHVSLTGVNAFLRSDLQTYCREPPKDFNATQRSVFCVFSGEGVAKVRRYLLALQESEVWAHVDSSAALFPGGYPARRESEHNSPEYPTHVPPFSAVSSSPHRDDQAGLSSEQRLAYMARLADWRALTARSGQESDMTDFVDYRAPPYRQPPNPHYQRDAMVRAQARMDALDLLHQRARAESHFLPSLQPESSQYPFRGQEMTSPEGGPTLQAGHELGPQRRHFRTGSNSASENLSLYAREERDDLVRYGTSMMHHGPLRHSSSTQSLSARGSHSGPQANHIRHREESPERARGEAESPKSSDDERAQSPMQLDQPSSRPLPQSVERSRMSRSTSGSGLWDWWRASRMAGSSSPARSPLRQAPAVRHMGRARTMDQDAQPLERMDDRATDAGPSSSIWPWSR